MNKILLNTDKKEISGRVTAKVGSFIIEQLGRLNPILIK